MALRTPKYRRHKGSGQALVQINGQRIYLGKHGSEQSKERYRRLVARHLQSNEAPPPPSASAAELTVNELIVGWSGDRPIYLSEIADVTIVPRKQDGFTLRNLAQMNWPIIKN